MNCDFCYLPIEQSAITECTIIGGGSDRFGALINADGHTGLMHIHRALITDWHLDTWRGFLAYKLWRLNKRLEARSRR